MLFKHELSVFLVLVSCLFGCEPSEQSTATPPKFLSLDSASSGISFMNQLTIDSTINVFLYRNYYNGGGVSVGDVTGDGLEDLYFTANQLPNRLYKNLGNLKFEDITVSAGVGGQAPWSTGTTMADVNGDGLLDIYVCNSGDVDGGKKQNELFINQGNGTFIEQAAPYGLADGGYSTHAAFFDYDHDGDLDCFVLNNSFTPIAELGLRNLRNKRDSLGGDRLYRNDDNVFSDVSAEAGIYGGITGFGLGVAVSDLTDDGWEDIYISNDFYERDYLYINQRDGTFKDELTNRIQTLSQFSMGSDIADLNNDGLPEIFVTDMLPGTDQRMKEVTKFSDANEYNRRLEGGFHHQSMRNTLQWNLGDGTFAELAQMKGVAATDWSWGALLVDLDNDGYRDIYVSNGNYKDVTNQDFIKFMSADESFKAARQGQKINFQALVDKIPSTPRPNFAFQNVDGHGFIDRADLWGLAAPTFSNGAVYADLDQDGDYELVLNNLNQPASIYKNLSVEQGAEPGIKLKFKAFKNNTQLIGAKVSVHIDQAIYSYEHLPNRGFQSSSTYQPLLTLPSRATHLDSIVFTSPYAKPIVRYPEGIPTVIIFPGAALDSEALDPPLRESSSSVNYVTQELLSEPVLHTEDYYSDFDRDQLLYFNNSADGPAFATGHIDKVPNSMLYFGGSAAVPGRLLLWNKASGKYITEVPPSFISDKALEDGAAAFIDYDRDGDLDLVVGSTGGQYFGRSGGYRLRLYEQIQGANGSITFRKARQRTIPFTSRPVSSIVVGDFDADGWDDFVISGRLNEMGYGLASPVTVFRNQRGRFTRSDLPLANFNGLVSSLAVADVDRNGRLDLIAVGEYMPVTVLYSKRSIFDFVEQIPNTQGLYRAVAVSQDSANQRTQLICGNIGNNTFISSEKDRPIHLFVSDVDSNGFKEHVYAWEVAGEYIPVALKHDLERVLPAVKGVATTYQEYIDKSIPELLGESFLKNAIHLQANQYASIVLSKADTGWVRSELPNSVQTSIVLAIAAQKNETTGQNELLIGGNLYGNNPRVGPIDASRGIRLVEENGIYVDAFSPQTLSIYGQVRHLVPLITPSGRQVIAVVKNQGQLEFVTLNREVQ